MNFSVNMFCDFFVFSLRTMDLLRYARDTLSDEYSGLFTNNQEGKGFIPENILKRNLFLKCKRCGISLVWWALLTCADDAVRNRRKSFHMQAIQSPVSLRL